MSDPGQQESPDLMPAQSYQEHPHQIMAQPQESPQSMNLRPHEEPPHPVASQAQNDPPCPIPGHAQPKPPYSVTAKVERPKPMTWEEVIAIRSHRYTAIIDPVNYDDIKQRLVAENTIEVQIDSAVDIPSTPVTRLAYSERLFNAILATPKLPTARGFDAWLGDRRPIELEVIAAELLNFAIRAQQGVAGIAPWERDMDLSKREHFHNFAARFRTLENLITKDKSLILSYAKANFGHRIVLGPAAEGRRKANNFRNNKRKAGQFGDYFGSRAIPTSTGGSGGISRSASSSGVSQRQQVPAAEKPTPD